MKYFTGRRKKSGKFSIEKRTRKTKKTSRGSKTKILFFYIYVIKTQKTIKRIKEKKEKERKTPRKIKESEKTLPSRKARFELKPRVVCGRIIYMKKACE